MAQVGNKNIDNASGQVVRLDIEDAIEAVATNNFGARNSAGTILPCEFLADDTTNKLLIRKSSGGDQANPNPTSGTAADFFTVGNLDEENLGLLPKEGGTMTGPLLGDDGSGSSSPAYSFDNDSDTGMFRSGSNTIGFSTAGEERVVIDDTSLEMKNQRKISFRELASNGNSFVSLKSPAALSGNVDLTLPSSIVNGGFLQTDNSGNLSFSVVNGVPTGAIFALPDTQASGTGYQSNGIPTGYLECNGANISRSTFAALFAVIGTRYGTGDGATTFGLPDLRGEFIRGWDNNRNVDAGRNIGSSQGSQNESHDHDADATAVSTVTDPGHRHTTLGHGTDDDGGGRVTGSGDGGSSNSSMNNNSTGVSVTTSVAVDVDNEGGESRPRNVAMMYIIKV